MQARPSGTLDQRAAVCRRFEALQKPEAALAIIRRHVRSDAVRARCSPVRDPSTRFVTRVDTETADRRPATYQAGDPWDRFVVRVDIEAADCSRATYALKGYADDRGEHIAELYRALSADCAQRDAPCPAVAPLGYIRLECECLGVPLLRARAPHLVEVAWNACLEAMPDLSTRNVAFFYAMTLVRKLLLRLFRISPADRGACWNEVVTHVAARATKALAVAGGEQPCDSSR